MYYLNNDNVTWWFKTIIIILNIINNFKRQKGTGRRRCVPLLQSHCIHETWLFFTNSINTPLFHCPNLSRDNNLIKENAPRNNNRLEFSLQLQLFECCNNNYIFMKCKKIIICTSNLSQRSENETRKIKQRLWCGG